MENTLEAFGENALVYLDRRDLLISNPDPKNMRRRLFEALQKDGGEEVPVGGRKVQLNLENCAKPERWHFHLLYRICEGV